MFPLVSHLSDAWQAAGSWFEWAMSGPCASWL